MVFCNFVPKLYNKRQPRLKGWRKTCDAVCSERISFLLYLLEYIGSSSTLFSVLESFSQAVSSCFCSKAKKNIQHHQQLECIRQTKCLNFNENQAADHTKLQLQLQLHIERKFWKKICTSAWKPLDDAEYFNWFHFFQPCWLLQLRNRMCIGKWARVHLSK